MKEQKIAVIGYGMWGRNIVRNFYNLNVLDIVCDLDDESLVKVQEQFPGVKVTKDFKDILNDESTEHGYHEDYGVLGSNKSKDGQLKLFPRGGVKFVNELQAEMRKRTGKTIECMVYGDGAFKDPVGGIWELADPVVSPAFTDGLLGTPNEIKLKYVADNKIENLTGEKAVSEMKEIIKSKEADLKNKKISLGTTPRRITDLVGSLSDLVSGSGDKGTPIVLITGYFDNYADE